MEIKEIKLWPIVLIGVVLSAVLGIFVWDSIKTHRDRDRLEASLEYVNGKVKFYQIIVDNLEEQVSEAKAYAVAKDKDLVLKQDQIDRLEALNIDRLNMIGRLNVHISFLKDSIEGIVPLDTIVREVEIINDTPMLPLPTSFRYSDDYLHMFTDVGADGLATMGATLNPTPVEVMIGSRGVFRKDYVSAITSPSPYIEFDMQQIQIVAPKKTKIVAISGGIGFVAGVLVGVFAE
jgi:hypothetical protein